MNPRQVTNRFGGPLIYLEETESTMIEAREQGRRGEAAHGTVVVAGYQSAGRGRGAARRWSCPPGEGLLFTLVLSNGRLASAPVHLSGAEPRSAAGPSNAPPSGLSTLPLRAGLALALVLEERYDLRARVKWPNDVLVGGKKIAGILCEAHSDFQLLAMGVNVGARSVPNDEVLRWPATSLAAELGTAPQLERLLTQILETVERSLEDGEWRRRLESRLYGTDRQVAFVPGTATPEGSGRVNGRVVGIDPDGRLLFRREPQGSVTAYLNGEFESASGAQGGRG